MAIFTDGFESGDFSAWSGSSVTSGDSAVVTGLSSHHGLYSGSFATNGGGGVERAYVYRSIDPQSELYARGYFNVQSGLPLLNTGNRFNLLAFLSGSTTLGVLSVRRFDGADVWSISSVAGGQSYASSGPVMGQWYCVEFYVKVASKGGVFRMWVDGVLVLEQTGLDTDAYGDVNSVRSGLVYVEGETQSVSVYGDCIVVSDAYIGPESVKKGGNLAGTMAQMLNSKMLFSAVNPYQLRF